MAEWVRARAGERGGGEGRGDCQVGVKGGEERESGAVGVGEGGERKRNRRVKDGG